MDATIQTLDRDAQPAPPLSESARRRYTWMRWLTVAGVTVGCLFTIHPSALLPGAVLWAILLAAYVVLVRYQYGRRIRYPDADLAMHPLRYLLLSALLVFGLMTLPSAATGGQSLWYSVVFFVVLSEGRHLGTVRALSAMVILCIALVALAVLIDIPRSDWLTVSLEFLPLYAGLGAAATGARFQRTQELEHAERLALVEKLARSKADLEEANHQLQVYAGMVEQLAVANERTRLARDLHDILGYTLATVVVKAEAAKRLLATDVPRAVGELDRVQEVARSGLAEVRRSVAGLRELAAAPGVWHEAMARFVDEFARETGIEVAHRIDPLPEGHDAALELCLFRVIQESLTNVARHARAGHVDLTLRLSAASVELGVKDDGAGSAPFETRPSGFGLRGMRERVEALGGHLLFSSQAGEGSRVLATIPLVAPTAHSDGDLPFDEPALEDAPSRAGGQAGT